MDDTLKPRLQLFFINSIKNLNSLREIHRLLKIVDCINSDVDTDTDTANFANEFFKRYSKARVRNEFNHSFYSICLNQLLTNFNPNLTAKEENPPSFHSIKELFIRIISACQFSDSFLVIYELCVSLQPSSQRDFCVYLMNYFVKRHLMRNLFAENVQTVEKEPSVIENDLVQKLVNLPDKFAPIVIRPGDKKNDIFLPKNYFKIISVDLWSCFSSMCGLKTAQLNFISNVYGKICFLGYSEVLNVNFLRNLIKSCYEIENWRSISRKLFESISANYLESCLLNLVNYSSNHQDLDAVLGDLVLTNSNVRYFLVEKFIFLKVFKNETAIQNLIGYLHESSTRKPLYYELFKKLLNAWSTKASIVNTPHEQHLYLTKCIIMCVSFMNESDKGVLADDLLRPILQGVEKHLCSPFEPMRVLGMVVGEILMNDLTWAAQQQTEDLKKLKFDYENTDEVKSLVCLRKRPDRESVFKASEKNQQDDQNLELLETLSGKDSTLFENDQLKIKITQSEMDSDEDDLVPFDLTNDLPLVKTNKPAYLRDCLDALIFSEDPDKIEISIKAVENLCESYHYELEEICVELTKVLLHKTNSYSIESFDDLKANAMISVTVHYPIECAQYLTSQFYEQGYSVTQRIEILNVLVMSAQKLSSPNEDPIFDKRILELDNKPSFSLSNLIPFNQRPVVDSSEWREAVQKRIDAKTRIKKTASSRTPHKAKENRYSDVFGHFFFPLLSPFDKKRAHMNMIEQDFELLGKLIHSLAVVLYSAANTSVVENMINAFTDFLWAVRNHIEPFVRKSIIFGFMIILMVISDNQLFISLNDYFMELKFWLENVVKNDPDTDCQKRAIDCLSLVVQRVKVKLSTNKTD